MPRVFVDKVVDDLYVLRVDDDRTRFFEALWEIEEGITYNAYLLLTGEGAVVFDGWKKWFSELFLEKIREIVDYGDIRYVVVHHAEPDHSGSVPDVLRVSEKAVALGHPIAGRMLSSFYGVTRFRPVKDGEELKVGERSIHFVYTPWLHWPETIMSYLRDDGVLLSCDAFGSYSVPALYDESVENFEKLAWFIKKYYVTVIGHYSPHVLKALEKLGSLGVKPRIIAPSHGTIFRRNAERILDEYRRIALGEPVKGKAVVVYVSMYGFVERLVSLAIEELSQRGFETRVYAFTDTSRPRISDILGELADAELLVLGGATYEAGVQPVLDYVVRLIAEKLEYRSDKLAVLLLSSYGWAGTAGKLVAEALKGHGFQRVSSVEVQGYAPENVKENLKKALDSLLSL
ncbi:FprA family A-type flavoprotein [Thermofilum pendens]|uniref:Beta-lactamase domain protein n=1 Tax=Thermofilum pendens (strain DSM 2475 / Hrk 5) TaxID=368408 RepID=A1RXI0_THEPD|nr:FprA family A-type flavoprotein [Thermofilum pendens]ABL77910.1 beta-lactamase domain protein [Thermofilum pendens Hrk 5]